MDVHSNDNITTNKADHNEETEGKTEDTLIHNFDNSPAQIKVNKRFLNLIDSDSEDDNVFSPNKNISFNNIADVKNENVNKQKSVKKISLKASKENAMKDIHSENQRFLRERNVALPYHRPKQRSLQEFFNRKKVLSSLPEAPTMAAKIKISTLIVSKILEEKEKEAELFYKSSDSEEEIPSFHSPLKQITISDCTNEEQKLPIENINVKNAHSNTENCQDIYATQGINKRKLVFNAQKDTANDDLRHVKEKVAESSTHEHYSDTSQRLVNIIDSKNSNNSENHGNSAAIKNNFSYNDIEKSNVVLQEHTDQILDTKYENKETALAGKNVNNPHISMYEADNKIDLSNAENVNSTYSNNDPNIVTSQFDKLWTEDIVETPSSQNSAELQQKDNINMKKDLRPMRQDTYISEDKGDDNLQKSSCISTLKINNDYAKIVKQSLGINEAEREEYNEYGLPPPSFDDEESAHIKKRQTFNVLDFHPKLKGIPGTTIDLPFNIKPKEPRMNGLINRFLHNKHGKLNKSHDDTLNVTAIDTNETENGVSVIKEILSYNISATDSDNLKVIKPGAKLLRLKKELKHIIDLKRCAEWRKREQQIEMQKDEENELHIQTDCSSDVEPSEEEQIEEGDSDEEEEYVYVTKKKQRGKCLFADDEADVSVYESDENDEILSENNDDEYEKYSNGVERDDNENLNSDNEDRSSHEIDVSKKSKIYRRIINLSDDDSNIITSNDLADEITNIDKNSLLNTKVDVHTSQTDNDNDICLSDNENQLHMSQRCIENDLAHQTCHTPESKANILDFISPITQLSALNTRSDYEKEDLNQTEQFSFINELGSLSVEKAPTKKLSQQSGITQKTFTLQKKFFEDSEHITTDEDLLQLCSGNFPSTGTNDLNLSRESNRAESQILDLGCGTRNTQLGNEEHLKSNDSSRQKLSLNKILKPNMKNTQNIEEQLQERQDSFCIGLHVFSSDEEDKVAIYQNNRKQLKRKVKKLDLSDEDDNEKEIVEGNDDSTLDDKQQEYSNCEEDYIDYDSEENEVTISRKQYVSGFVENEAELSESDWDGSEDEDEKDLDTLELEEGDHEELDENQVKDQLGKIHMRQMLDDDQRNIRMLKEILFEDGDLHADGSGRERKFKWKNIDKIGNDYDHPRVENEDGFEDLVDNEGENEIKWRKMRYEREKFLEEKMKNLDNETEDNLDTSKIFQTGLKICKKHQDTVVNESETTDSTTFRHTICEMLDSSHMEGQSHVIHKILQRRSFLARGDAELARIRPILEKQKDLPVRSINKRNFVFACVDSATEKKCEMPEETKTAEKCNLDKNRKRKSFADAISRSVKRVKKTDQSTKRERAMT